MRIIFILFYNGATAFLFDIFTCNKSQKMQFRQELIVVNQVTVHLLHYQSFNPTDYLDQLTELEKERYFEFQGEARKQEFVATRILRHALFGFKHIHYNEHGAPYIEDEGYISISHTKGAVAIAVSNSTAVGVDLELIGNRAKTISKKFLSERELNTLDTTSDLEITIAWSAKEVLYKLAGRKQIDFKKDLSIDKITSEKWQGIIRNPDILVHVELAIFVFGELIVSVNSSPVIHEKINIK